MPKVSPFIWLAAGGLLIGAAGLSNAIPIVIWLALAFVLRAARAMRPFPGLVYVAAALYGALALANRGVTPVPDPAYFGVIAAITATASLPFVADRLLSPHFRGWISTLIFPLAWAATEFLRSRVMPGASWGSVAYSQYGNLPLMQLAAVTGIWGISFLIAWFASVVNWAWDHEFTWSAIRGLTLGYAGLLVVVLVGGGLRLALARSDGRSIRSAVVSFPVDMFVPGEVTRITEGRIDAGQRGPVGEKLAHLQDWFLESTRREARAGAQLIAWPEANLLVLKEDEASFLERAGRLAAEERIYVAMGMGAVRLGSRHPFENKIVLVDPSGQVAFSYLKSHPVAGWEASIMVRGDGRLPLVMTTQGRIASAICYDADFPDFVRQIGHGQADLWVLPVNDWERIKHIHYEMAAFRAIENGTPMLRAASRGLSGAFDPWGRVLGVTDHFSGARTMVAQVPVGGIRTPYSYFGDLFAWLCVGGLAASVVAAMLTGRRRPETRT